ncbi:MAG: hypothetical protein D6799_06275 [Bacteroidetes bacterium]|nr:MAG: hypothetical protein D6799_06275 [Bacteroidota bacterium]
MLLLYLSLRGQNNLPLFSLKGEGGIQTSLSSEAFRNTFVGEFQTGGQLVIRLFHRFYSGIGFNYALFKTSKHFQFRVGNVVLPSDFFMRSHNTNVTIGYFMPVEVEANKPAQFGCIELRMGYGFNRFTNIPVNNSTSNLPMKFNSAFLQPHFSYTFMVEENLGFGGYINYTLYTTSFNPKLAGLDYYVDYSKWKNNFNISWVTLGLHFHLYFIKFKKQFD